jgi:preprotein translocase subunit SecD
MAAKKVGKKQRPVRLLVALGVIILLMYGSVGFGVVQWKQAHSETDAAQTATEDSSATEKTVNDEENATSGNTDSDAPDATTPDEASSTETPTQDGNPVTEDPADATQPQTEATPSEEAPEPVETPKKDDAPVSFTPKFALDLAGGTQLILKAQTEDGSIPDDNALDRAIDVIRQRIDASGVSESEISKQGSENIVVGIPGETPSDETIKLISNAAKMSFRPVIAVGAAQGRYYSSALGTKAAAQTQTNPDVAKYDKDGDGQIGTQEEVDAYIADMDAQDKATYDSQLASDKGTGTSKYSEITEEDIEKFNTLDCTKEENVKGGGGDDASKPLATCAQDGTAKYMLAPVAVEGDGIDRASAGLKPLANGKYSNEYVVSLQFKEEADDAFINISKQIKTLDQPRNQFAITLDGLVISAPSIQPDVNFVKGNGVEISSGQSSQSQDGANSTSSTRTWATTLANQLSFGALPMNFEVDSKEQVSASLGSEQLEKGLLAGIFGLLLVVLFSLFQYRALGLVTVSSLLVAALLTYGSILLLSWQIGYRLSLPGIIGIIVSIGITADSFIVYFERIRDELRDGRNLEVAVNRGWTRALQTILASDTVNVLCALILYLLAVGGVRGFAFTLGLTTVIDLVVVCMFTHPVVVLLTKMHFFREGHPLSGLSAFNLGADNARKYRALSRSEKDRMRKERLDEKKAKRQAKDDLKKQKLLAKGRVLNAKKLAKLHQKEHEALMGKKLMMHKSGAVDPEELAEVSLSIAEKKALAAGKDVKKIQEVAFKSEIEAKAAEVVENDPSPKEVSEEVVDLKPAKKPVAKRTTTTRKPVAKPAAKRTATASKPAAKKTAGASKTVAKPAAKKTATASKTAAKPAAKKTSAARKPVAKPVAKPAAKKTATKKKEASE